MRTALGVIAGCAIFAAAAIALFSVSGHDPRTAPTTAFLIGSTLYGMIFAAAGGYAAGAIARRHDRLAATLLAVLIALVAGVSTLADRGSGSTWTQLIAAAFIAPSALAGGAVHHKRAVHYERREM